MTWGVRKVGALPEWVGFIYSAKNRKGRERRRSLRLLLVCLPHWDIGHLPLD